MITREDYKIVTKIIVGTGIILVSMASLVKPKLGNRTVSKFNFQEKISIPYWQKSENLNSLENNIQKENHYSENFYGGKTYQYNKNETSVRADMYYLVGTRGDVNKLLKKYPLENYNSIDKQKIKQNQSTGFYSLFQDGAKAYLSSCINSRGNSTVTHQQFSQNLDRSLNYHNFIGWLLGKESLRDRRCLWVTLSTDIRDRELDKAYNILERVWVDWYEWWQPRFPHL